MHNDHSNHTARWSIVVTMLAALLSCDKPEQPGVAEQGAADPLAALRARIREIQAEYESNRAALQADLQRTLQQFRAGEAVGGDELLAEIVKLKANVKQDAAKLDGWVRQLRRFAADHDIPIEEGE